MNTQETTTTKAVKTKTSSKKAQVTKAKRKSARKAKTKGSTTNARTGSKTAIVLELMRRKEGATLAEIAKATDWQNDSIRGFISGQLSKKMELKVESTKSEAGERTYRIVT